MNVLKEKARYNAELSIRKYVSELMPEIAEDLTAVVLWSLHRLYGFGKKRLLDFHNNLIQSLADMQAWYELPEYEHGQYLCRRFLKEECGIDVKELEPLIPLKARIHTNGRTVIVGGETDGKQAADTNGLTGAPEGDKEDSRPV